MKYSGLLLLCFTASIYCLAQTSKHLPKPKAKALEDSAISKYQRAAGDPVKVKEVFNLLDEGLKADNNYYEGWINKMTLQSQLDHYDDALATLKKMEQIFPQDLGVPFHKGILLYITGKTKESLAIFNNLLGKYNALLEKTPKSPNAKGWLINKGIILILADREKRASSY